MVRGTPETGAAVTAHATIEALLYALRRGFKCFDDNPDNLRRLGDCNTGAFKAVMRELRKWDPASRPWLRQWTDEELDELSRRWGQLRKERRDT